MTELVVIVEPPLPDIVVTLSEVGLVGPRGKSAYDVAVDNGFVGTQAEWLATIATAAQLVDEIDARAEADMALDVRVDAVEVDLPTRATAAGLAGEADARADADAALDVRVDAVELDLPTRATAAALAGEADARADADAALDVRVDAVEVDLPTRATAAALAGEADARADADAALDVRVDAVEVDLPTRATAAALAAEADNRAAGVAGAFAAAAAAQATADAAIPVALRGGVNGVASLDANGRLPVAQLTALDVGMVAGAVPAAGIVAAVNASAEAATVARAKLPIALAYTDAVNTFTALQQFGTGGSAGTFISGATGRGQFVAASAVTVPLTVKAAAAQTANMTEWQDSAAAPLAWMTGAGSLKAIRGAFGQAVPVTGITSLVQPNAAADIPLVLRGAASQSADLQQWQDSAGSVKTKVQASGDIIAPGVTATWAIGVTAGSAAVMPLSIKGAASQTANLTEWRDSTGAVVSSVSSNGTFQTGPNNSFLSASNGRLLVQLGNSNTTLTTITAKGVVGQTGNLQEWQNSAGVNLAGVVASGGIYTGDRLTAGNAGSSSLSTMFVAALSASEIATIFRGKASQTSDLTQWQDSTGAIQSRISPIGAFATGNRITAGNNTIQTWAIASVDTNGAANVGIAVRGRAGQTADLQQWQDSAGSSLASIAASGTISTAGRIVAGASLGARLDLTTAGAANVGAIVRASASQTGNLQEWQDSAGTLLTRIASAGAFVTGAPAYFGAGATSIPTTRIAVGTGSAATTGVVIRAVAAQAASMLEAQDSVGVVLSMISKRGEYENAVAAVAATDAGGGTGGIVLRSPDGTRYRYTAPNGGGALVVIAA